MQVEKESKFYVKDGRAFLTFTCDVELAELLEKFAKETGKDRAYIIVHLLKYALQKMREEAEAEAEKK